jgi:protoporphyrinogen/coproporphyrinogen III oxidase
VEDAETFVIFLDHNKAPDRAPPGQSLMNVQTDVRFAGQAAKMSDAELVSWAKRKAEKYFPEIAGHFDGTSHVARWPRLGNLNTPGYYRNVARFLERLDPMSRIQPAGDMFTKTSQEGAATWGEHAAETIIRLLRHR